MISWFLYINNDKEAIELKTGELIEIKETDRLFFVVKIKRNILEEVGYPILLLEDIPVIFDDEGYIDNDAIFMSQKSEDINQLRYFYNFFGESEAKLSFQKDDEKSIKIKFNILARKENAVLAKQMLDYLTSRIDDAIFICFSRSSIHGTSSDIENFNFNKFNLIEELVDFLRKNIYLFVRENKHTWQTDIILSKIGQPTGVDSVYWVLSNLDKITLNNGDNVNIFYNNKGYSLSLIPKEIIKKQTDTYENRVIKSFLYHAEDFLNKLKKQYSNFDCSISNNINNDYVRFDHTMSQYINIALEHKIKNIHLLQKKLRDIHYIFDKILPAKLIKNIYPKFTPYVNRHYHYREVFSLITKCLKSPSPKLFERDLLFGIKNLAIIYELTILMSLHDIFINDFNVKIKSKEYRQYLAELPFGGKRSEASDGVINNFFSYYNDDFYVDIYYEPKIFSFKEFNKSGDLINISNNYGSKKYGEYYICPDFIVKISSELWKEPIILILDAKYKNSQMVKKYDFDKLTLKYLINIHQVNEVEGLSNSFNKILFILFPHQNKGIFIKNVSKEHLITGKYPALPQTIGLHFNPMDNDTLVKYIQASINYMNVKKRNVF